MNKKINSLFLATTLMATLVGCGNASTETSTSKSTTTESASAQSGTESITSDYQLDKIKMVVNGTLTATLDNGQEAFEKQWEDAVGVDLEIQQLDHSSYVDAVGRLFASGDYPDVLVMSADMYAQYVPTGLLWDMTEAYNNAEFQSRITAPQINQALMRDGKLYGFAPAYGNGCVTYLKKAWLDACGIDVSTIKTYDDYYNMLRAFHEGDPDGNGVNGDTYGVIAAGFVGNEAPYINYLPEFWQDAYPAILQGEDGTWYDGFQTQETKDALLRLQKAYSDGVIDPETLTASTKIAREKWTSNEQSGSSGSLTYWAGTWYQNLADLFTKNDVNTEIVQLPSIAEVGAYINREAPVWVIVDDGDGDNAREQAIFDKFIGTMMDGGRVQTLWTFGAEDVHWSTKAESFTTNADDPDKKKEFSYEEGEFHLKPLLSDPNTIWKRNVIDPALSIAPLVGDFADFTDKSELASQGNAFFVVNCKDAPISPASETYTNESGTIYDAKLACITAVVVEGVDVETAMQTYISNVGSIIDQCLAELNG